MLILLILTSNYSQALTAKTSNFIQGNPPFLTFDGGRTRVVNTEGLLWITLSDGTKFTPVTNNSSTTPIELPNFGESFVDVAMLVPLNANSITLNSLIGSPNNYWGDDDGDGQGRDGISVSGNLSLSIVDKNNLTVARSDTLTNCNAPYKLTLTTTNGTLNTLYGVPKSSNFSGSNVIYYIKPKDTPKVCFVKPNTKFGSTTEVAGVDFRGSASMWNEKEGFIPQSFVPSRYYLNFPTTAANNLYFDLKIAGSGPLNWRTVELNGIKATMEPDSTGTLVRVKLTGPVANEPQWKSDSPTPLTRPRLPQIFELVGRDNHDNVVVKYGFELKQWFINRGTVKAKADNQSSWCRNIGYRLPEVKDLTNASCTGVGSGSHCKDSVGVTPSSPNNNYQRMINGGFFSEWGYMFYYDNANFDYGDHAYWTGDPATSNKQFVVSSSSGFVNSFGLDYNHGGLCVSALRSELNP